MEKESRFALLFICLGNICRSPAAQAVMQKLVDDAGLSNRFYIDSAGIGGWHVGQLPDKRMRDHARQRGYRLTHRARQIDAESDFGRFDRIVVMDEDNYRQVAGKARSTEEKAKVVRMADYFSRHAGERTVPDPYYGGPEDFELALDLIEDGCRGILAQCRAAE
ncbi:MAG: low molecular weight protein-tyrosine-phosphatase [Prevotella sp.]